MTKIKSVDLSIVIPAYNEAERLPGSLKKIRRFIGEIPFSSEVIVVVEESEDSTLELSRMVVKDDPRFKIIDNKIRLGKGYAVRTGMLLASARHVFFMDTDLSTPLTDILVFLDYFSTHPEVQVLIGSRAHPKSRILQKQYLVRQNMGKIFNLLVHIFAIRGIKDTQCGFKSFRKEACREIFSRQKLNRFAFDVEVLVITKKLGYLIESLPVTWINSSESKVHMISDSLEMFRALFLIRRIVAKTFNEEKGVST